MVAHGCAHRLGEDVDRHTATELASASGRRTAAGGLATHLGMLSLYAVHRVVVLTVVAQLTMAAAKCFASGDTIAILLKIESPRSPALAKLLSHNAHLSLVKRQKTWISLGAQISIREQCLSRAELYLADDSQEGVAYLRLEVQAGESGRETSWRVKDSVAVEVRNPCLLSSLLGSEMAYSFVSMSSDWLSYLRSTSRTSPSTGTRYR